MKSEIVEYYKLKLGYEPYSYQIEVAQKLLSGKNVILSVPTGAGKTWASIIPFLYAREIKLNFPQKMIYSLPLRTLTNSIYEDVKNKFPEVSRQTGEYAEDKFFEKDIIFSTIDQTLSNFLCFPLPLSQRLANINAGALIGSYLVFDEFHLLDPKLSMATSLGMIRLLKNLCRVCIMTATLTDDYIKFLRDKLEFEIVTLNDFPDDVKSINSLKPAKGKLIKKSVTVCLDRKINANSILEQHKSKTIVICNRVETAQSLYTELASSKLPNTALLCIHSRYFDSDRKKQEQEIKKYFGKNSQLQNAILIATQVIEAGMDISCDTMHTEISPINSFLQRAGRCARFENEYGDIYVYDVLDLEEKERITIESENKEDKEEIRKLNNKYLPYEKELCKSSLTELSKFRLLDENVATLLVNNVLKGEENKRIHNITANIFNTNEIKKSWNDCNKKHYRETIRDIQSIELALIDLENYKDCKIIPWKYETISVYRWSFIGWAKQLIENKIDPSDWVFAKAEQGENSVFDFEWIDKDSYFIRKLPFDDLRNHFDIIFIDNRYFNYTKAGLFVMNNDNNVASPLKNIPDKEQQTITYKKDTFYQHNKALLNCFETEFKLNMQFVFPELDKYWKEKMDWQQLIRLMICLHDYGKLNAAWQKPMKEFQRRKYPDTFDPNEVLAHTDYNDSTDRELAKECKIKSKPPHAGIGAFVFNQLFLDSFGRDITQIVAIAILKHHGVDTTTMSCFSIDEQDISSMQMILNELGLRLKLPNTGREKKLNFFLETSEAHIIYFFLVRILRLCDQKATELMEYYLNLKN